MKNFWIGAGSGILFLIIVLSVYFFSGVFNIATDAKHPLIEVIMDTVKDRSVDFHSGKKLIVTKSNADIKKGAADFMDSCVMCHGAPGYEKNSFAKYIDPIAPDFSDKDTLGDLSDANIFYVIKNGIRMTAMPAFGKIEKDPEIQNDILFIKEIQNLKEADIKKLYK